MPTNYGIERDRSGYMKMHSQDLVLGRGRRTESCVLWNTSLAQAIVQSSILIVESLSFHVSLRKIMTITSIIELMPLRILLFNAVIDVELKPQEEAFVTGL